MAPYPLLPTATKRKPSSSASVWLRISAFLSLKSPNTQDTYLGIIREWCSFLGAETGTEGAAQRIVQATDLHAIAYRNWLEKRPGEKPRSEPSSAQRISQELARPQRRAAKKEGLEHTLSNATIAKKFAVLRRVYRMLIAGDCGVSVNPFDSDRVPPPPKDSGRKRPTRMIDFDKVMLVIEAVSERTPKGLRDKAILCALFGGALRRSEVRALRVGDVRISPKGTTYLYLRSTKAKRDAEQALPPWAATALERLAAARRTAGASEADYLFTSFTGRAGAVETSHPVSNSGIYKLFKRVCLKAGAGAHVSPHSARATAITRLLDSGIPHREVQEFSRHSSIQMVELYDKRRIGVDRNAARNLSFSSPKRK